MPLIIGLKLQPGPALNTGGAALAPAGYKFLLYKDAGGTYRQLQFRDGAAVYKPLAYKVA